MALIFNFYTFSEEKNCATSCRGPGNAAHFLRGLQFLVHPWRSLAVAPVELVETKHSWQVFGERLFEVI